MSSMLVNIFYLGTCSLLLINLVKFTCFFYESMYVLYKCRNKLPRLNILDRLYARGAFFFNCGVNLRNLNNFNDTSLIRTGLKGLFTAGFPHSWYHTMVLIHFSFFSPSQTRLVLSFAGFPTPFGAFIHNFQFAVLIISVINHSTSLKHSLTALIIINCLAIHFRMLFNYLHYNHICMSCMRKGP